MLRQLSIRDFVIVDALNLEPGRGFTALTGETGAGKSILVDALALLSGERTDASMVRHGQARAELSAEFECIADGCLAAWLQERDLGGDPGTCLLRRVIESEGRSRAYVNGHPVPLAQLREVAAMLVDIHGQHAHQALLQSDAQRALLDQHGGLIELGASVAGTYQAWRQARRLREQAEQGMANIESERDELELRRLELERLAPTPHEWAEIDEEHRRLAHAGRLIELLQSAIGLLEEDEAGALADLGRVTHALNEAAGIDARLMPIATQIESARDALNDATSSLRRALRATELDPQRLAEIEGRLDALHHNARKYRVAPPELAALLEETLRRLAALQAATDLATLSAAEREAELAYRNLAQDLSTRRMATVRQFVPQVQVHMRKLGMPDAVFDIALSPVAEPSSHGLERIDFLVSTNPGVPPRALSKVASGGELSRVGLALQVCTTKRGGATTLVFDEVDAGIGGGTAEVVGRLLRELGHSSQVLCVTHLPQVAAQADHQWSVSKSVVEGTTVSALTVLGRRQRVEEIARMLGGLSISETTRRHARELLGTADDDRDAARV